MQEKKTETQKKLETRVACALVGWPMGHLSHLFPAQKKLKESRVGPNTSTPPFRFLPFPPLSRMCSLVVPFFPLFQLFLG